MKDRKVASRSSIGSNLRQELIFNASNINKNLTVHNIKFPRNSLLFNNKNNDLSNKKNNNDTFENDERNKLLFSVPDALIMMSNVTGGGSTLNSQQIRQTIDIASPSVSTLFSTAHSSVSSAHPAHSRRLHSRILCPSGTPYEKCKDKKRRKDQHSHRERHKRIRCKNNKKYKHRHHRHHRHRCDSFSTSPSSSDSSFPSPRVYTPSPLDNFTLNQLPDRVNDTDDDDTDDNDYHNKGQVIAVENLVMTSLPNNFTDEDDPSLTTAASESHLHGDTSAFNDSGSFTSSPSSSSPFQYPIATASVDGGNTASAADDVTIASSDVKDDTVTAFTSSRQHEMYTAPPASSSSPSSTSSQDKSTFNSLVLDSIEKARGVPALPYFFLNPCSGYAVSLTDSHKLNAIHEVPVETHQLISNLTKIRGRWTRHLTRRGSAAGDQLSLLWYFQKNIASSVRKKSETPLYVHEDRSHTLPLDILIQSAKRVSRSAHNPSQVSSEQSTSSPSPSSSPNNFGMSLSTFSSFSFLSLSLSLTHGPLSNPSLNQILENFPTCIGYLQLSSV